MSNTLRRNCGVPLFTSFFVLVVTGVSAAQVRNADGSQLTVTVADITGARIAGATARLTRGSEMRTGTSGSDGLIRLRDLAPGEWTLTVTRDGFAILQQSVAVPVGSADVGVALQVAGLSESVQVEGVAPAARDTIRLDAPATGGTRMDLPVRDLPVSLSLVSQAMMQERGARSALEATDLVVGMVGGIGVGSIPGYATRGFSGNQITLMRDGVRQNTTSQSSRPIDTFIIDRVEVLKGPASVLYGEGAVGAAVNVVSKEPQPQLGVDGLLSYGDFGTARVGIGVTGPLGKQTSARVDASLTDSDGYADRSGQKLKALGGSVRWMPTSSFQVTTSGTTGFDSTSSYYGTPLINGAIDPRTRFLNYNMTDNLARSRNAWGRVSADLLASSRWTFHNELFVATHGLDWRNLEGYAYNPTSRRVDVFSYFLIWRDDVLTGNRLHARGNFDVFSRPARILLGMELQRNHMLRGGLSDPSVRFSVDPFSPQPIADPNKPYVIDRDVLVGTAAGYAETMVEATKRLKVIGGLRWERISLDYTVPPGGTTSGNGPGTSGKTKYYPTTGRVGVVWSLTDTANAYGSFSRAVEPTTQLVFLSGAQQIFSLSPGRQWEFGTKASALNGRIDATLAFFDIEKRDILTTSIVSGQTFAQQIGRQVAHGIELSVATRPTRRLTVTGDVALTDAAFADFTEVSAGANASRDGNVPPNVPETVASLWASHQIGPLDVSASVRHVGDLFANNANTVKFGNFTTADASVSYRLPRGVRVMVRGRNLTDKLYAVRSVSGGTALRLEAPRSVDVTFSIRH